jgi:hypothetical protein
MKSTISPKKAVEILQRSGIRYLGILDHIQLFIIKPTGRLVAVYNEHLQEQFSGVLSHLKASGGICVPLMVKEAFIEALIAEFNPEEHDMIDMLVSE